MREKIIERLRNDGFDIMDIDLGGIPTTFAMLKEEGWYILTPKKVHCVFFGEEERVSKETIEKYSEIAYQHSLAAYKRPFFDVFPKGIISYALLIADVVHGPAMEWIKEIRRIHDNRSVEIPIILERSSGQLHYFQKSPRIWARLLYNAAEKFIEKYFNFK